MPCLQFSALSLVRPGLYWENQGQLLPNQCDGSYIYVFPLLGPNGALKHFSLPLWPLSRLLPHPLTGLLSGHGCWGPLSVCPTHFLFSPSLPFFSCKEER